MASWWDEPPVAVITALRSADATPATRSSPSSPSPSPSSPATPASPATGAIVVFSSSELIGDGLIALLPREWREWITLARDLAGLEQLLDGPRPSVIVDADTAGAGPAVRITRVSGGSAILLVGDSIRGLDPELLEEADAVVRRDEVEPLTLRVALAAGRVGMRLVPRSLPAAVAAVAAAERDGSALTDSGRRALVLLAQGKRDAEIARELSLSESAVRKLIQRTVRSVGARTRCQAVAITARTGQLGDLSAPVARGSDADSPTPTGRMSDCSLGVQGP
jgi:DNA-binding CsgD family transcriptional regulator